MESSKNHVAKAYTGIYSMHKYWSKKPYNIIHTFIENYTQPGEIVLDPFCGSGIAIIEASKLKRMGLGVDINPMAIFITNQSMQILEPSIIEKEFEKLESRCEDKINQNYRIFNESPEEPLLFASHYIWKDDKIDEIWTKIGKTRQKFKPTLKDQQFAQSFRYETIPYFYPKNILFHNTRINTKANHHLYELFSPRNILGLSFLWNEILKITDEKMRAFFQFVFTGALGQTSKMVFVIRRKRNKNKKEEIGNSNIVKEVGSWVIGYWVPKEHFEINVWKCFKSRYMRVLKAKKTQFNEYLLEKIKNENLTENTEDLNRILATLQANSEIFLQRSYALFKESALDILKKIPSNSIDYIITDPPHGNRIPYLELSLLWNAWFQHSIDYQKEIIVSDAKMRQKDQKNYDLLLSKVFKEIYRVLKPNHNFSLMFNCLDDHTWLEIFTQLKNCNFILENIGTLNYSANSVIQDTRTKGLKTDFIFTFSKKSDNFLKEQKRENESNNHPIIQDLNTFLSKILKDHPEGLYLFEILNAQMQFFLPLGQIFPLTHTIKQLEKIGVLQNQKYYQNQN